MLKSHWLLSPCYFGVFFCCCPHGGSELSVIPVPGVLKPFSSHYWHQVYTWGTDKHAGRTSIFKKVNLINMDAEFTVACGPHVTQRLRLRLSGIVHVTIELTVEMSNVVMFKLAVFIRTVLPVGMVFPPAVCSSHLRVSPPKLVL